LRIGDAAGDPGALIPEPPLLGVQLLSNFSTAPGVVLSQRPSVSGALDSPATANVYVDGRLVLQQNLPTGPFSIDNVPVVGDVGHLQVITKDASGHEQVITSSSYYGSSSLLRKGIGEFSLGAGLEGVPTGFGMTYAGPIAQAFEKRGLTDRFTGEFNAQLAQSGSSVSAGGLWLVPGVGTLDAALTAGAAAGKRLDYEYTSAHGFGFGIGESSLLQETPILLSPGLAGLLAPLSISRSSQMHVTVPTSSRGALSFSVANQSAAGTQTRTLMANYLASLPHRMQLQLSLFKTSGSLSLTSATAQLSIPLDARRQATLMAGQQGGSNIADLTYTSQAVFDGAKSEPGYSLTMGSSDLAAQLSYTRRAMDFNAGFSKVSGVDYYQLEAQGSLASLDRHLLASRSIEQAYGVAIVPGYPNVRVYANGRFEGRTNARGEVLLPDLQAYQRNVVSLEAKDVPVTANIDSLSETVVPYYHTPVTVRFPVRGDGGVLIHVRMLGGSFLPSGAVLSAGNASWTVADEGEAYLDGVMEGPLHMEASGGDIHCTVFITVPKDKSSIPDLGEFVCR
jgi:outer membrane usher protein